MAEPFADPSLPGLRTALEPGAMLDVFRTQLAPTGTPHLAGCRLTRIRYRAGSRAIVQYAVRTPERSGPTGELWVSATLYPSPERSERLWRRLKHLRAGQTGPLAPSALLSDPPMVLQVFPVDRRLPSLRAIIEDPWAALAAAVSWSGGTPVLQEHWVVQPVRYRAGLSAVLRYGPADDPSVPGVFVKIYRKGGAAEARSRLADLAAADGRAGFRFPRVLGYLPDLEALIQEGARGSPLAHRVAEGDRSALEAVGEATATFNRSGLQARRRFTSSEEIGDLRRATSVLSWAMPSLGPRLTRIVRRFADQLESAPLGPTHGDMKDDHVFLGEGRPWLVDVDSYAAADPVIDPSTLLARLRARELAGGPGIAAARAEFEDAYFRRVPRSWRDRLPVHFAGHVVGAALGLARRWEAGWQEIAEALVADAERALDRGELP